MGQRCDEETRHCLRPRKAREISPLLWIVAAGFVLYFARSWVETLIGL